MVVTQVLVSGIMAQPTNIEQTMIEKGKELIVSKIGNDCFNNYIKLLSIDYQSPTGIIEKPYYLLTYTFKIPEKQFVNELIEIGIDIDGNIVREWGIPDNPDECEFPVDKAKAIGIARDAGLEEGIKEWETDFHWHDGLKTYVWAVRNTLSASSVGEPYEESGKVIIIDANSGEVKESSNWTVMSSSASKTGTANSQNQKIDAVVYAFVGIVIVALISIAVIVWKKKT